MARCREPGWLASFCAWRERCPLLGSLSHLPGMSRTLHNVRPLYLLALFQLVGGPVVLLLVILLGKLSVPHVAEHGLTAGITETLQSKEWQAVTHELLQDGTALPASDKDKIPTNPKETKAKLFVTDMDGPVTAPVCATIGIMPWSRSDVFACVRSQAPPGPPPRLA
jgi:hypothetical protein